MTGDVILAYWIGAVVVLGTFGAWYMFVEYVAKKMEWDMYITGIAMVLLYEAFWKLVLR
jgi:hypothetical protein